MWIGRYYPDSAQFAASSLWVAGRSAWRDIIAWARELESIRDRPTGQALTFGVNLFLTVVLLAVTFFHSGLLTSIVLLSLPVHALIPMSITRYCASA